MGSGTFIADKKVNLDDVERRRMLDQFCQGIPVARPSHGFSLDDPVDHLKQRQSR